MNPFIFFVLKEVQPPGHQLGGGNTEVVKEVLNWEVSDACHCVVLVIIGAGDVLNEGVD